MTREQMIEQIKSQKNHARFWPMLIELARLCPYWDETHLEDFIGFAADVCGVDDPCGDVKPYQFKRNGELVIKDIRGIETKFPTEHYPGWNLR